MTQAKNLEDFSLGSYGAILADPPWAFRTWSGKTMTPHRTSNDHYATMPLEALEALPVSKLAARDCALFMWVVDSHLPEALKLAEAWGFKYKTRALVWEKTTHLGNSMIGMGYWTRKQTEACYVFTNGEETEECLLFTRGHPKRVSKSVRQLIKAPRREHSRKPDDTYERIEALVAGPYLELFARCSRPGWDAWGNETNKFAAA